MHPEDRVLVAVMNRPKDLELARSEGWYRLPEKKATAGAFFEYVAFYFTAAFAEYKWAIHYYARRLGHELLARSELLPDEPEHPRARDRYYKLQLGPLQRRDPPIVSLRWRRISFIHTTWDRFEAAQEINDLFLEGDEFVDRLYHALRESDLAPERQFPVRESGVEYLADLALPCRDGVVSIGVAEEGAVPGARLCFSPETVTNDIGSCVALVREEVAQRGGIQFCSNTGLPVSRSLGFPEREVGKREGTSIVKVTVKLGAPLSQVVGESKITLSMPEGATVADLLDELRARHPDFDAGLQGKGLRKPLDRVIYSLFVDARPLTFQKAATTRLRDGNRVYLFLPVAGG